MTGSDEMTCQDCDSKEPHADLHIVVADYGYGAFLAVLCEVCDHRRRYRAELRRRKATGSERYEHPNPDLYVIPTDGPAA